jgi:hypothetical protein
LSLKLDTPFQQSRAFSKSSWSRLADVQNPVGSPEQEREFDEVDVCIIGGGL